MSGEVFEFNELLARAGGTEFAEAANGLESLTQALKSGLSGNPWSDDEIGSKFHDGFAPDRADVFANTAALHKKVESFVPKITEAANAIMAMQQNRTL
ncbi:hypothetical protein [Mycobacterium talmoniae]|nr:MULTISPECIES: hypothetical protein [Mycobacterium]PQM44807.1 hypothetical protein C1Y40_05035 [Mycobacterium talmoniae]TDH49305.1 hypothetical protein E2F47_21090 [Mycobacterium eburneum]